MSNYLIHHGIKGQKWGDRRYQNEDGSWTQEGRIRYGKSGTRFKKDMWSRLNGYQNRDGSLTEKGRDAIKSYKTYKNFDKETDILAKKMLKEHKNLRKNIDLRFDTIDNLIDEADSHGYNTKDLKVKMNSLKMTPEYSRKIQYGEYLINKMKIKI
jgi:hypothetical protein